MAKTVAEVMTPNPLVVKPETPVSKALKLLAEKRISGLPVVDEEDKVVGIISETDLMWQATGVTPPAYIVLLDSVIYLENPARYEQELHKSLGQTVGDVMSKNPIGIAPEESLVNAAKLLHEKKIHRLIVEDANKKLLGILTCSDVVREMAANLE